MSLLGQQLRVTLVKRRGYERHLAILLKQSLRECRDGPPYETSDTMGNDTESSTQAYGDCWGRSSSPFRDHADRDLDSPVFQHMQCLLACRVKFIHIARFLSNVADGTESLILDFSGLFVETPEDVNKRAIHSWTLCVFRGRCHTCVADQTVILNVCGHVERPGT